MTIQWSQLMLPLLKHKPRRARPHTRSDAQQLIDATIALNSQNFGNFPAQRSIGSPRSGPVLGLVNFHFKSKRRTSAGQQLAARLR